MDDTKACITKKPKGLGFFHFEVAIATATMIFGLYSGASLATVMGVLIEVPLMLALVR